MIATIFNPPAEPCRHGTIVGRRKIHVTVITANRTIRLANTKDVLQHEPGGLPISDTLGPVEIEWAGDIWVNGIAANAGTTQADLDW